MKSFRIQKRDVLNHSPIADVILYANSFEKALEKYGAVHPKQWYQIGNIRRYQDRKNWFFDIWPEAVA